MNRRHASALSAFLLASSLFRPPVHASPQAVDEWPGSMTLTSNADHTVAILTLDRATEDSFVDVVFAIVDPSEPLTEAVSPGALRFEGVIMPVESRFIEVMLKSGKSYHIVTPEGATTEPRVPGARVIKATRLMYYKTTASVSHARAVEQLMGINWSAARR